MPPEPEAKTALELTRLAAALSHQGRFLHEPVGVRGSVDVEVPRGVQAKPRCCIKMLFEA